MGLKVGVPCAMEGLGGSPQFASLCQCTCVLQSVCFCTCCGKIMSSNYLPQRSQTSHVDMCWHEFSPPPPSMEPSFTVANAARPVAGGSIGSTDLLRLHKTRHPTAILVSMCLNFNGARNLGKVLPRLTWPRGAGQSSPTLCFGGQSVCVVLHFSVSFSATS